VNQAAHHGGSKRNHTQNNSVSPIHRQPLLTGKLSPTGKDYRLAVCRSVFRISTRRRPEVEDLFWFLGFSASEKDDEHWFR
jgi:hypothetical protein